MSKKTVEKQSVQERQPASEKDQTKRQYRMLEAVYADSPYGRVATRKEFRCIRCFVVQSFDLPDQMLSTISSEETTGDFLVDCLAMTKGWLYVTVLRNGSKYGYTLCPSCVENDYARYARFAKNE